MGRFVAGSRQVRYRRLSLLAQAYRWQIPVTVYEAIGTDIIHNRPAIDASAPGRLSPRYPPAGDAAQKAVTSDEQKGRCQV